MVIFPDTINGNCLGYVVNAGHPICIIEDTMGFVEDVNIIKGVE